MRHLFKHWWQDALVLGTCIVGILALFKLLVDAILRGGVR